MWRKLCKTELLVPCGCDQTDLAGSANKSSFQSTTSPQQSIFCARSLKITRTYSLLATPHQQARFPPRLDDCLFADSGVRGRIEDARVDVMNWPKPAPWKKTFYSGDKEWESGAPDPSEPHRLKKLFEAQRHCHPPHDLFHIRSFEERVASDQRRHSKKGAALQKRLQALKALAADGPAELRESSSSDAGSCTDSSESEESE